MAAARPRSRWRGHLKYRRALELVAHHLPSSITLDSATRRPKACASSSNDVSRDTPPYRRECGLITQPWSTATCAPRTVSLVATSPERRCCSEPRRPGVEKRGAVAGSADVACMNAATARTGQ